MPELPEVEQAARTLGEQIVGATFSGQVRCLWPRTLDSVPAADIGAQLQGVRIAAWRRRAKWIILPLANDWALTAHLRMTGRFAVCIPDTPDDVHLRVAFGLMDGREVRFMDQRKFGRIHLCDPQQLAQLFNGQQGISMPHTAPSPLTMR